jgi:bifunctional non-homologous end joining protein LigD
MGLEKYWQKRDFSKTPEPRGKVVRPGKQLAYYIQEHHATRLHYDFRLELDGTLKSWAIPKGPSLDPADKRLAVHVEDHPMSYGTFEGDIPKGNYGAGHVKLWDRGVWEPEGDAAKAYKAGRLKFHLDGRKLHGAWTLVRMGRQEGKQENWLLIKEHDEEAREGEEGQITVLRPESVADNPVPDKPAKSKAGKTRSGTSRRNAKETAKDIRARKVAGAVSSKMPEMISPQLATLAQHAPDGDEWLSEVKFDGYRAVCRMDKGEVSIYTRAGNDWTRKWPAIADALRELPVENAWLDGEVVAIDREGKVSFQALQNMMREGKSAQLAFYVFDLMYLNGFDLTALPLVERKRLLKEVMDRVPEGGPLIYSDHMKGGAREVFEHACMHGMEGIVVKRADAAYLQSRGRSWLKVKCQQRQEFVIGGYTDPSGSREAFGALLLGVYDGERLQYCGKVGTGFNDRLLRELHAQMRKLEQGKTAFANPPTGAEARGVHWLKPQLVAEVEFAQWTNAGNIRHASFVGLRADKPAEQIVREKAIGDAEIAAENAESAASDAPPKARRGTKGKEAKAMVAGIALTHPNKILFPRVGLTKLGLAEYYEAVAEHLLPHLQDRPLTLVRCPQGDGHKCFFQKHVNETVTDAIERVEVPEEKGTDIYMMANSLPAVIGLVQMGVLELHTWGSREGSLTQPDRLIFDLDPDQGLDWKDVVEGAQLVRGLLDEIGLRSFLKTTGGKGLHIVVPIKPERTWEEVKPFTRSIAEHLARVLPERFTSNLAKSKRGGRIFIDYLRNGQGATAVAAFSTRAKPDATVSMPIFWEELDEGVRADTFNVRNATKRLAELKDDPWKDYWKLKQRITDKMLNLFDKR